jgi:hypothetical protein
MTETPSQAPLIEVRPQPNIYTVLLLVAIMALAIAIGVVLWKLTSAPPTGYGLQISELLDPIK